MIYITYYKSPVGKLTLASENNKLIGLWIEGQKYFLGKIENNIKVCNTQPVFLECKKWLDRIL